jgi:hypothetical protein
MQNEESHRELEMKFQVYINLQPALGSERLLAFAKKLGLKTKWRTMCSWFPNELSITQAKDLLARLEAADEDVRQEWMLRELRKLFSAPGKIVEVRGRAVLKHKEPTFTFETDSIKELFAFRRLLKKQGFESENFRFDNCINLKDKRSTN